MGGRGGGEGRGGGGEAEVLVDVTLYYADPGSATSQHTKVSVTMREKDERHSLVKKDAVREQLLVLRRCPT